MKVQQYFLNKMGGVSGSARLVSLKKDFMYYNYSKRGSIVSSVGRVPDT